MLQSPVNDQIFNEIEVYFTDIQQKWQAFPKFPKFAASQGVSFDPGTSINKSYARQLVLNVCQALGAEFTTRIDPNGYLIVTGLSYEHGGKMPPHVEHKDGKDCDVWSDKFRKGTSSYSEAKTIASVVYLIQRGVSRVIYTDDTVVNEANRLTNTTVAVSALASPACRVEIEVDAVVAR